MDYKKSAPLKRILIEKKTMNYKKGAPLNRILSKKINGLQKGAPLNKTLSEKNQWITEKCSIDFVIILI